MIAAAGAFDPQGPIARAIDDLWWLMLVLGTVIFVGFCALLARALFRAGTPADESPVDGPNRFIVLGGVVLPAVVLAVVMVATVRSMTLIPWTAPKGALQIELIGHRWWYEVRYPEQDVVTANEVHIPVGRPVAFRLKSADVIHSFWIPELGGKIDLLPEHFNTLVLEADRPGVHRSHCAEFCGLQHARMGLIAVVESEEDFAAWLSRSKAPAGTPATELADRGRSTFMQAGCAECHTIRGTSSGGRKGPDLTHLASRDTLGAATVPNTRDFLEQWIADPHKIKRGVDMPPAELDDDQMAGLLAYLQGLR